MSKISGIKEIINICDFKRKGKLINWKENIGLDVSVLYDGIKYDFKIVDYDNKKYKIYIQYNGNVLEPISTQHFLNMEFGNRFKERVYLKDEIKKTNYEIDYERCLSELSMNNQQIDNLSYKSDIKLYYKCKECKNSINKLLKCGDIFKHDNFAKCNLCGNTSSFAERLFYSVMSSINIKPLKTRFEWSEKREYDAYFEDLSTIVELHGEQHYISKNWGKNNLSKQVENDEYKKRLAIKNGIKHYIEIDCRDSSLEWVKKNILESKLSQLIDFSDVDWELCYKNSNKSIALKICSEWNKLDKQSRTPQDLVGMFGIKDSETVRKHLKIGNKIGMCEYSEKQSIKNKGVKISNSKKFKYLCRLNNNEIILNGQDEIVSYFNVKKSAVASIIKSKEMYKPKIKSLNHLYGLTIKKIN